jgi:hypothetical protein
MSEERADHERPCLHCMMVDLIDDFFAEYPLPGGGSDKVDTGEANEVIVAREKKTIGRRTRHSQRRSS